MTGEIIGEAEGPLVIHTAGLTKHYGNAHALTDHDIQHASEEIRRLVGYMPEHNCLPPV